MEVMEKNGELRSDQSQSTLVKLLSRAQVLYCAMVSGFDNIHIRANIPRLEEAVKFGNSAGDRSVPCSASYCPHVRLALEYTQDLHLFMPSSHDFTWGTIVRVYRAVLQLLTYV